MSYSVEWIIFLAYLWSVAFIFLSPAIVALCKTRSTGWTVFYICLWPIVLIFAALCIIVTVVITEIQDWKRSGKG